MNNQQTTLTKKCCRCPHVKPVTEFNKAKRGLYGVHSICRDCKALYMLEYRLASKLKISKDKYRNSPEGQEVIKAYTKSDANKRIQTTYSKTPNGKASRVNKLAKYRAIFHNALPDWANLEAIKLIYKNCPKGYEVDHIIPLQGELITGLHLPENLQYLTREENATKSNRFDGTLTNNSWRTLD